MPRSRIKQARLTFHNAAVIFFSIILIIILMFLYLDFRNFLNIPSGVSLLLRNIMMVIATLFVTSLLLRLTIKRLFQLFDEPEESIFYSKIYSWTLYSISIFIILYYFGVSLGNITLFLGLIATGLAFAIRDVLLSFFGWMILLRKNPFRIGDYIRIGDDEGKVIHIGTFYVLLDNTPDIPQDFTRVPNRLFLEKSINNLGKSFYHDKIRMQLSKMPINSRELLAEIQKQVRIASGNREYAHAYIDVIDDKLLLNVEYLVAFEIQKDKRSEIIQKIFMLLGDTAMVARS